MEECRNRIPGKSEAGKNKKSSAQVCAELFYYVVLVCQDLAGSGAGGFVAGPDESAVDKNLFNAGGEFVRFGEGGVINDSVRIEEDNVGDGAFFKDAAISPTQAASGEA